MDCYERPDYRQLLGAVLAEPGDDVPRLLLADYLDEQPENVHRCRAAFIRCQVQLASRDSLACERTGEEMVGYGKFTPRCRCPVCRLKRREYQVSCRHIAWDWTGGCGEGGYGPLVTNDDWHRGFVRSVTCELWQWLQEADDITRDQPVTRVEVEYLGDEDMRQLANRIYWTDAETMLGLGSWSQWCDWWRRPDAVKALNAVWPGIEFTLADGATLQTEEERFGEDFRYDEIA